jgi:hypothetical protein
MPDSHTSEAHVFNSLLRCTRSDDLATGVFESISNVPGLWVLELEFDGGSSWSVWLTNTFKLLSSHRPLLIALGSDSRDYTLHITLDDPAEHQAVSFPPALTELVCACGISIELYVFRY